jgi:hypothetical protein
MREQAMNARILAAWGALALFALSAGSALAGTTAKVGGTGGTRTVVLDCGTDAFAIGLYAQGGKDNPMVGMNLVRQIQLRCRKFSNHRPLASAPETVTAVARSDFQATADVSTSLTRCGSSQAAVSSITFQAGAYIDRIQQFQCMDYPTTFDLLNAMNVGGFGGSRMSAQCPRGEALYKLTVRVGGAIDSVVGTCRPL